MTAIIRTESSHRPTCSRADLGRRTSRSSVTPAAALFDDVVELWQLETLMFGARRRPVRMAFWALVSAVLVAGTTPPGTSFPSLAVMAFLLIALRSLVVANSLLGTNRRLTLSGGGS